ncbi:hypothetical protein [Streptomyces sp. NPDC056549]|uniref:hypothetical protein n=1 Tax=Streptomyces sp. NPDC056549 TaxID=3345864 RepID=UPI003674A6A0
MAATIVCRHGQQVERAAAQRLVAWACRDPRLRTEGLDSGRAFVLPANHAADALVWGARPVIDVGVGTASGRLIDVGVGG